MERKTLDALGEAIGRQYKARATYCGAIERFGRVKPFVYLADTSAQDVEMLRRIYQRNHIEPPPDPWPGRVEQPQALAQACREAMRAEAETADTCERLLNDVDDPVVRLALSRLEEASRYQRQPLLKCTLEEQGKPELP